MQATNYVSKNLPACAEMVAAPVFARGHGKLPMHASASTTGCRSARHRREPSRLRQLKGTISKLVVFPWPNTGRIGTPRKPSPWQCWDLPSRSSRTVEPRISGGTSVTPLDGRRNSTLAWFIRLLGVPKFEILFSVVRLQQPCWLSLQHGQDAPLLQQQNYIETCFMFCHA